MKKLNTIAKRKHSMKSAMFAKHMLIIFVIRSDWVFALVALTALIRTGDKTYENKYFDRYPETKPILSHINGINHCLSVLLLFSI